jgi:hypothetical protein
MLKSATGRFLIHFPTCVIPRSRAWTCLLIAFALATLAKTHSVWAANASPSPDFIDVPAEEKPMTQDQKALGASIDIAPQPPASPDAVRKIGYFHKYRQGLSAQINAVYDTREPAESKPLTRGSLNDLFSDDQLHFYEAGADLLSNGTGSLSLARRWIFARTRLRPFTKAGFAVVLDPNDELRTFLKVEHYQARASFGFERLISDPISVRFELEGAVGTTAVQVIAGVGLAWAW